MMIRHKKPLAGLLCGTLLGGTVAATPAWAGDRGGVSWWRVIEVTIAGVGVYLTYEQLKQRQEEAAQKKKEEQEKQRLEGQRDATRGVNFWAMPPVSTFPKVPTPK